MAFSNVCFAFCSIGKIVYFSYGLEKGLGPFDLDFLDAFIIVVRVEDNDVPAFIAEFMGLPKCLNNGGFVFV